MQEFDETFWSRTWTDIANKYEEIFFDLKFEEFAKLLESNWLRPHSEYDVFELVLKWVRYDVVNREDKLASLIGCVRLPLMSADELDKVSRSEMVATNKECLQLYAEATNYKKDVGKQPLWQTIQTQVRSDIPEFIFSFKDGVKCMNAGRCSLPARRRKVQWLPCGGE